MSLIYLDNAATTKISQRALKAYVDASEEYYLNPSASYKAARRAKERLEEERDYIKRALNADDKSTIVFTSGATESIQSFLLPLSKEKPGEIIATRIEHAATKEMLFSLEAFGWKIKYLKTKNGSVDISSLDELIGKDTRLVLSIHTSNANGNIQDIKRLTEKVRNYEKSQKHRILIFSDMVQSLEKIDIDLKNIDIDGASFSSHKINGPKGVGALYIKRPESFIPFSRGGGQESGLRGGTENLPGVLSFTEAIREHEENKSERREMAELISKTLREGLVELRAKLLTGERSSPYITSFSYKYPSEVTMRMLYDKGFIISAGSACSNNKKGSSEETYRALGYSSEDAKRAIRLSISDDTTLEEAKAFLKALGEI